MTDMTKTDKKCPHCGAPLAQDASFCPRCTATQDYAALCDEMLARMEG